MRQEADKKGGRSRRPTAKARPEDGPRDLGRSDVISGDSCNGVVSEPVSDARSDPSTRDNSPWRQRGICSGKSSRTVPRRQTRLPLFSGASFAIVTDPGGPSLFSRQQRLQSSPDLGDAYGKQRAETERGACPACRMGRASEEGRDPPVENHNPRLVHRGDGRWEVCCPDCERTQDQLFPIGIGIPIVSRLEAEGIVRNHAATSV
jgi:hypothetical protein